MLPTLKSFPLEGRGRIFNKVLEVSEVDSPHAQISTILLSAQVTTQVTRK